MSAVLAFLGGVTGYLTWELGWPVESQEGGQQIRLSRGEAVSLCDREAIWNEGFPGHYSCEVHGHRIRWNFDQDLPVCVMPSEAGPDDDACPVCGYYHHDGGRCPGYRGDAE